MGEGAAWRGASDETLMILPRRQYSLQLTEKGPKTLEEVSHAAYQHQEALCAALAPQERDQLAELLRKVTDQQGLTPGVHFGYRWIKRCAARQRPHEIVFCCVRSAGEKRGVAFSKSRAGLRSFQRAFA